ncbi:MAG: hypothetical protein KGI80_05620 [Verrucomicrobiota bacterium]|nr:hypothetical protein [Verrucomicrobiota bacterium]
MSFEVRIPPSLVARSPFLQGMEEDEDNDKENYSLSFSKESPNGLSPSQIQEGLYALEKPYAPIYEASTFWNARIVAQYLLLSDKDISELQSAVSLESSSEILKTLESLPNINALSGSLISLCISEYIRLTVKEGKGALEALRELAPLFSSMPLSIREALTIELDLLPADSFDDREVQSFVSLFPSLKKVQFTSNIIQNFAYRKSVFGKGGKELRLNKKALPPKEGRIDALQRRVLNYFGYSLPKQQPSFLQNFSHLQEMHLDHTPVTAIPPGCPNLEVVSAVGAQALQDVSGLNNLLRLRELYLDGTSITAFPQGCPNLEIISVAKVRTLQDFSAFNHRPLLRELYLSHTCISRFPQGCPNLEVVSAVSAGALRDISGLDQQLRLRELYLDSTGIERFPQGCSNLEIVSLRVIYSLRNVLKGRPPELDGLLQLRELYIDYNTLTTTLPQGCINLEIVSAQNADLWDVSDLDGLSKLRELYIDHTRVRELPRGCPNLKIVSLEATWVRDVSMLDPSVRILGLDRRRIQNHVR